MMASLFDSLPPPPPDGPYGKPPGRATPVAHYSVAPTPPCDPRVAEEEKPRLNRQCEAILKRLRGGRATNKELAGIAIKYGGRISDCRAAGYDIRCIRQDHATGEAWYALHEHGVEVSPQSTN